MYEYLELVPDDEEVLAGAGGCSGIACSVGCVAGCAGACGGLAFYAAGYWGGIGSLALMELANF
jgi:hypothetical protein